MNNDSPYAPYGPYGSWSGGTEVPRRVRLPYELQLCDELGFDYGFCIEHHFRPDESWMTTYREPVPEG